MTLRQCSGGLLLVDAFSALFSLVGLVESSVDLRSPLLMVIQIFRITLFVPLAFYMSKVFFSLKGQDVKRLLTLRVLMLIFTLVLQLPEALFFHCTSSEVGGSEGHRTRRDSLLDDLFLCNQQARIAHTLMRFIYDIFALQVVLSARFWFRLKRHEVIYRG